MRFDARWHNGVKTFLKPLCIGGFQLVDLTITELKYHMPCQRFWAVLGRRGCGEKTTPNCHK